MIPSFLSSGDGMDKMGNLGDRLVKLNGNNLKMAGNYRLELK